jgi:hypothetical protein
MFDDLDAALQHVLADPAAPQAVREADVSFETPSRDYTPTRPTLNLFLHEVSENRARRDPEPVLDRTGAVPTLRAPPLRVDCAYLVTAWADPTAGAAVRTRQEHHLLGTALAWLARFDTLPEAHLAGALAGQPFPPPFAVARPQPPAEPAPFWTALGLVPRPALGLRVTVSVDPGRNTPLAPAVRDREIRLVPVDQVQPGTATQQNVP